jgi:hypothetical protein
MLSACPSDCIASWLTLTIYIGLAVGARRAGIGQTGTGSWTVLADPEGNEFCVIGPNETLIQ